MQLFYSYKYKDIHKFEEYEHKSSVCTGLCPLACTWRAFDSPIHDFYQ